MIRSRSFSFHENCTKVADCVIAVSVAVDMVTGSSSDAHRPMVSLFIVVGNHNHKPETITSVSGGGLSGVQGFQRRGISRIDAVEGRGDAGVTSGTESSADPGHERGSER